MIKPLQHLLTASALFMACCNAAHAAPMTVTSTSFVEGQNIPVAHAGKGAACGDGQEVTPQIGWANLPAQTRSVAVVIFDPDGAKGLGVAHLVAYNIDPARHQLAEGEAKEGVSGITMGKNVMGVTAYRGFCPPPGDTPHHYIATVIATDLAPGALPAGLGRDELLNALKGHALVGQSVIGRYGH